MKTITPATPYRFHEFYSPVHAPFEPGPTQWPTIVAEFIRPVFQDEKDVLFWFLNHGSDFQLCFASNEYERIEKNLRKRQGEMVIKTRTEPSHGATLATAKGGTRWLAADRMGDAVFSGVRSELLVRVLHACSVLFIHQLVQKDAHWFVESNSDENNPLGRSFESLLHLIGNLSETEIEVELFAATQLMKPASAGKTRVRL